ncbi:PEP-CTERM sorting domain-containing protein [Massilia sp. erpn]|uniref:PEP-CTERM sorting domain-containing protein n=1 Tax=Massilia sp. erpn TaxID=2738142 RepID=UPI0021056130|nr:PEP-CTERM sorting domain-containing protein [Massilia sp. erpn]UTY59935.1 PEP-CTERM sorting domain-containing protein [Massilia sp. erpn]
MKKLTTHAAAIALTAATVFATPLAQAAKWVEISAPKTSGFTVGSGKVSYGPIAAASVWVFDGENINPQNAENIESLVEGLFKLPATGKGSLQLVGEKNLANSKSGSFKVGASFNYLAVHYGRGELVFHWDKPLAADSLFTFSGLPRGSSNYRAFSSISAVPEPATYGMLLGGLGLMALIARRRKQG